MTHHSPWCTEIPYFFPAIFANMIYHTLIDIVLGVKGVLDMYVHLSKASYGCNYQML